MLLFVYLVRKNKQMVLKFGKKVILFVFKYLSPNKYDTKIR